ncbi:MAG: LOG family protein, partial [Muribaculaceae bacterium]|nr:LOG family protein [Muribaculaceae bacterium]
VYVVLPGGIGTLDEWVATLSHNVVSGSNKKLLIVNLDGVFGYQWKQIAETASSPFANGDVMKLMVEAKSADEMIAQLEQLTK